MKILTYLLLVFIGVSHGVLALDKFPDSMNPEEFHREVIEYIQYNGEFGLGVDRQSEKVRKVIELDSKDWEAPLAEVLSHPRKYQWSSANVALHAAAIRKSRNDPRIHAAVAELFRESVKMSIEKLEAMPEDGAVSSGMSTWVAALIAEIVGLESPNALQPILEFLHSPDVDRFDTLQNYSPKYIAPALLKYGDLRNAGEAVKVAAKLDNVGRADVATDIRRAAEDVRKRVEREKAASSRARGDEVNPGQDAQSGEGEKPLWPWIAGAAGLFAAAVAYFRLKRAHS